MYSICNTPSYTSANMMTTAGKLIKGITECILYKKKRP